MPLKSDSEHLKFLQGLAALKVHFALRWALSHPATLFSKALEERTFFVNLGVWHRGELYDHPAVDGPDWEAWQTFLAAADAIPLTPIDEAERQILNLLPPPEVYFSPRVARDQAELHHPLRGLAARPGCLWLTKEPGTLALPEDSRAPRILEFHIANHRYPESFLKDPKSVRGEIRTLAQTARAGGFEALGTRTWLNEVPVWLAVFPEAWRQRLTPRQDDVGGHLGWWGQVVTARQTLSSHADAHVRTHGTLEFSMRASWLSLQEAESLV